MKKQGPRELSSLRRPSSPQPDFTPTRHIRAEMHGWHFSAWEKVMRN